MLGIAPTLDIFFFTNDNKLRAIVGVNTVHDDRNCGDEVECWAPHHCGGCGQVCVNSNE